MAIDPKIIREHYAALNDDALLRVDRGELTTAAQRILDAEVRRRGLDRAFSNEEVSAEVETPRPLPRPTLDRDADNSGWLDNALPITSFSDSRLRDTQAAEARETLLAAGIPCEVVENEVDPSEGPVAQPYVESAVMVPAALGLQATSVLDIAIFNPRFEEDMKAQFAELSDEELRLLNIDDLCAGLLDRAERMRRAYENELKER